MLFAFKKLQTDHKIDRFHFKSAIAMPSKNQICVVARGRTTGGLNPMKEQISGLLLFFNVVKTMDGKWNLEFDSEKNVTRFFPTIFPRQLDYI